MNNLALASIITFGVSLTSAGTLSRFRSMIGQTRLVSHIDQCMRAVLLAFAVYHIGYELMEMFTLRLLMIFVGIFFLAQYLIVQFSQSLTNPYYLHEKYPWLIYTLLIPHFITEGLMIAPQALNNRLNVVIAGFLIHKVFEVAMLTLSANNNIHCRTQRRVLQTLFVTMTPITILFYAPFKSLMAVNSTMLGYVEFLNFIVFLQLATFCQFCTHSHSSARNWFSANRCFVVSFLLISIAVYFYPSLLISGCSH